MSAPGPTGARGPVTSAEAIASVEAARGPHDLFGADAARAYRRLAQLTHPDTCPGDGRAARAFAKLTALWRQHQDGHGVLVARGDIANLYQVADGLLKLARDPADNDLMRAETVALAALRTRVEPRFQAYFPGLVRAQRRRDPGSGVERRATVIAGLAGFRSLAEVRGAFPGGLDPRDAAWMWRRLLVALGAAHRAELIHGAVLPEHVMIHPGEHGLVLIDWCALRLGVVRCYLTRHGPGPFVTEDPTLEVSEPHNQRGTWQGAFRTGHFDAVALRYAAEVSGGVDAVALTHLDTAARHPLRVCRSYLIGGQPYPRIIPGPDRDLQHQERLTQLLLAAHPVCEPPGPDWPGLVEDVLGAPVVLRSFGPTVAGKHAAAPAHVALR